MILSKQSAISELRAIIQTQCVDTFEAVNSLQARGYSCEVPWIEVVAELEKELFPEPVKEEAEVINLRSWVNKNRSSDKIPERLVNHLNRFTA